MKPHNSFPTIAWNDSINVTVAILAKDAESIRGILERLKIPYVVNDQWGSLQGVQQIIFEGITIPQLSLLSTIINSLI